MRKFVALALAMLMMLALIPTAFAAKGDLVTVVTNKYTYYTQVYDPADPDTAPESATTLGAIAYVSEKFGNFINWQVPGNALTGNALSWGKWIEVEAKVAVTGYVAGETLYLEGAPYTFGNDDMITVRFYIQPTEGGNQTTRTMQFYNGSNNLRVGNPFTVALIYQDIFKVASEVATEGINQANTYASIDKDNVITVDVVYSNLVAKMGNANPTNAGYSTVSYYPITVKVNLTDNDGSKYPAFTRVDVTKTTTPDIVLLEAEKVPNSAGICYLTEESTITFEKRFNPNGTQGSTLNVYLNAAWKYSGLEDTTSEIIKGYDVRATVLPALGASATTGFGGLTKSYTAGQPFAPTAFLSWSASDLSSTANGRNEDLIRGAIDDAIFAYYADPENGELYGNYAGTADDGSANALQRYLRDTVGPAMFTSTENTTFITGLSGDVLTWIGEWYTKIMLADYSAKRTALVRADEQYSFDYLKALIELLTNIPDEDQITAITTALNATEKLIVGAIAAYRADVQTALGNTLQPNASLFGNTLDEVELTLTKPGGDVSKAEFSFKYNSVSRITSKGLTSLQGTSITVVKGETANVTVNATQNGLPVTGLPIRFTSNDPTIATATDPKTQGVNTSTTTITGINVGTTFVKAWLDTVNDPGEAYIMVNVVEPTPVVPEAPTTTDYVCKVRKLWVRSGAGTSNEKVGYYSRNDVAKVYEVVDGWAKVDYNGSIAYSSTGNGKYLAPK